MKMKNIISRGWKLLLIVLTVLFQVSALTMEAGAAPMPDSGTLTIHKYYLEDMDEAGLRNDGRETKVIPESAMPLAGIEFTVWQVDPVVADDMSSALEAQKHLLEATKQTGVTTTAGTVSFSLERGIYYVAETGNQGAGNIVSCEPFLVPVPMQNPEGNGWLTDVHVYPKNQPLSIDKFVGEAGDADYDFTGYGASKYKPVAMDTPFGWSIVSSLPASLGTADSETYTVTDELKSCFDYVQGSVKVYAVPALDTPVSEAWKLSVGSDYILTFNEGSNTLKIALTPTGITRLGSRYQDDNDRYLLIKFDCMLNTTAPHGIRLYNGAAVEYTKSMDIGSDTYNSAGVRTAATSVVDVEPAVHTGQIGITKMADGTDKALSSAEFGLAASKKDAQAGNFIMTGTTDESGRVAFTGLRYGLPGDSPSENSDHTTYWLVETKAPDGYQVLREPVEITFNHQQEAGTWEYYFAQVNVYNALLNTTASDAGKTKAVSSRAKTGDSGAPYMFAVVMLLSLVVIAFIFFRRSKNHPRIHKIERDQE